MVRSSGAVMVQKEFKYKRELERAFIEILPGVQTIAMRYGDRLQMPSAYAFVLPERVIFTMTNFEQLFVIAAVFMAFSILCFAAEILWRFCRLKRR